MQQSKDVWFMQNLRQWNKETPGINEAHKLEDLQLHFKSCHEERMLYRDEY